MATQQEGQMQGVPRQVEGGPQVGGEKPPPPSHPAPAAFEKAVPPDPPKENLPVPPHPTESPASVSASDYPPLTEQLSQQRAQAQQAQPGAHPRAAAPPKQSPPPPALPAPPGTQAPPPGAQAGPKAQAVPPARRPSAAKRDKEINEKVKAFENHSMRNQFLYRLSQAITAAEEADKQEWSRRQALFAKMKSRMETGKATAQEIHKFLRDMVSNRDKYEDSLQKVTQFATQESGTLKQAATAVDKFRHSSGHEHAGLKRRVFTPNVSMAEKFVKEMGTQSKAVHARGIELQKNLESARKKMQQLWTKYESCMKSGLKAEAEHEVLKEDPFLYGKRYDQATRDYLLAVNQWQSGVAKLQQELKFADKRRLEKTKHILLEFLLAERARTMNKVKMLDSSLEYVKSISPEEDVNAFLKGDNMTLDEPNFAQKARTRVTRLIYKDVVKWGSVWLPGRMFTSSYKEAHAIITKFGFFHVFRSNEDLSPIHSFNIRQPDIQIAVSKQDRGQFTITVPNSSFFALVASPNVYTFKTQGQQDAMLWVKALMTRY